MSWSEVEPALERVYDAFRRERLRLRFWCAHCVSEAEVAELKAVRLREASWAQLEHLVRSAMYTFGDAQDARHCLPRMLELTQSAPLNRAAVLHLITRVPLSPGQRAVVQALFAEEVMTGLRLDQLDVVLAPVAACGLQPQLDSLLAGSPIAPRWYARLVCEFAQRQDRLTDQEAVLVDWVLSGAKLESLERAFFQATDAEDQQLFSSAIQVLEWF